MNGDQALPVFLQVLNETADQADADELGFRAAEAVEALTDSFRTLGPLARRCLRDHGWKSQVFGLAMVERLGKRSRRLLEMLMPSVESLLADEVEEIRAMAGEIVDGFAKGV